MALTIAIEGLGELDNAEAVTKWGISGSGGASFALDSEIYYQGAGSMSSKISSGKWGWLYYNHGSALNFTTTYAGQYILIWFQVTTQGAALALNGTRPGISIRIGSSTSVYREWALGGSDFFANNYVGGWQCAIIDPTSAGTSDAGAYSAASVQYIGVQYSGNAASRAENLFVDAVMVGSGIRITGTETTAGEGWQEAIDYCTDRASRAWGFIQQKEQGIFSIFGQLYVGDSGQTAVTSLTDSSRIFKFADYQYYSNTATPTLSSAIADGFNGLTVEDAASFTTTFKDGIKVGTESGRSGSTFLGASFADCTFDLYGGSSTSSLTALYSTTLNGITGGITWGDDANHEMLACTVTKSGQFDPVGAVVIRGCVFSEVYDDGVADASNRSALLWNSSIDIDDCSFIANSHASSDVAHAIEHDTIISVYTGTATTADALGVTLIDSAATFTGGAVAVGEYIYNETDGSYGKITSIDSATQLTHEALTGGTGDDWGVSDAYSISAAVTYTDLVFSGNEKDVHNSATGGDGLFVSKTGTSNPATSTGVVEFIGSVTVKVTVTDADGNFVDAAQTAIYLDSDGSEIMNADTNASGVASASYTGATPAAVLIKVRKSSTGTRYINFSTTGNIQSGTGLDVAVVLQEDTIA